MIVYVGKTNEVLGLRSCRFSSFCCTLTCKEPSETLPFCYEACPSNLSVPAAKCDYVCFPIRHMNRMQCYFQR